MKQLLHFEEWLPNMRVEASREVQTYALAVAKENKKVLEMETGNSTVTPVVSKFRYSLPSTP
jgi:hypothetical protein